MPITIREGIEGSQSAQDIAIVIDVLRAATVSAYLLDAGVRDILPVSTTQEAFDLQATHPELLLVGEEEGIRIPGFDLGNSPSEILKRADLSGKHAVHRSSTGTQGIIHAKHARELYFAGFVTAHALASQLDTRERDITIIPMYAQEDHLCAQYIFDLLQGKEPQSTEEIQAILKQNKWHQGSFLDPKNADFPQDDFFLCLQTQVFDFCPTLIEGKIRKAKE